ncbi:MAG: hypothetical protein QNJ72_27080 [Pleurocapsa sp. MO_226.B13]|nr:hypothetical protein [Pleurocapsa sp. MO_226.B13]
MLERILLAGIITFCIYLFLNLGGKSSNAPTLDAQNNLVPELIARIKFSF